VQDLTRSRLVDLVLSAEVPVFEQCRKRLFASREAQSCELRMKRRGAPSFWAQLDMTMAPEDDDDAPLCALAVSDITHRRRAGDSVARLAALVESTNDAIISRDMRGRVMSWNASAHRLLGYSADEILGRPFQVLVPPRQFEEEAQLHNRIRKGETVAHLETLRLRNDGAAIPVALTVSPIYAENGEIVGISEIARDMRAEQRARSKLREHVQQLDLLSSTSQSLIMGDESDSSMWESIFQRLCRALGARACYRYVIAEEPETMRLATVAGEDEEVGGVSLPAKVRFAEAPSGRVALSRQPFIVETRDLLPSAEATALLESGVRCYAGFPLLAGGSLLGVAAFGTSRERFQESEIQVLRTVCDQIATTLEREQLIVELRANEATLRDADRRKDDFIATLAHELRNPLAPIRNAAVALRFGGVLDPKFKWCRDVIERQVGVMAELLEDLLDVSRIARRRIELRLERIDLGRAISQAVETVRPLIDEMGHELSVNLPQDTITLNGDLTRLTQVFGNLLNNAAKYTERGGRISVSVEVQEREAVVRVRDSGIGIPTAHLPKVFELFSQVESALQRSQGGLGIGLSLVKALVSLHGGRVSAASEGPGKGSEFSVCLPIVEVTEPVLMPVNTQARALPAAADTLTRPRRVLVVDDNADVAKSMESMLESAGHEVRVATDGEHAIHLAEQYRPHAVLLDIGMPGMNGYEICRRIREQPWSKQMLIVACTGWGRPADRARAREAGFDHHLVKPTDPERLLNLIGLEPSR
jgi:PAS domain S-box-containing protein